jgi:hypothetical protein
MSGRTIPRLQLPLLAAMVCLICGAAAAADPPPLEFGVPYQMRIVAGGSVLEFYGSFTPRVAPDFEAAIANGRDLRVVHFESPGGHLVTAVQVAAMIQKRGLTTYVGHLCASACTVAFLGGRDRWLAPGARLGFHQARSEAGPSEPGNKFLGLFYAKLGMPESFVDHVMRTAPADLWFPSREELRAVHYMTADPPAAALALGGGPAPQVADARLLLRTAPDEAVAHYATVLSLAVFRLQAIGPEACWAFAHDGRGAGLEALPPGDLVVVMAAVRHLAEEIGYQQVPPLTAGQRQQAGQDVVAMMRASGQGASLEALRPGADHAAFCPAFGAALQAALALPGLRRGNALRALLSSG